MPIDLLPKFRRLSRQSGRMGGRVVSLSVFKNSYFQRQFPGLIALKRIDPSESSFGVLRAEKGQEDFHPPALIFVTNWK